LEDLLRLKRAEKPDAAFWQDFERGMRQKQLAAIIEPRPWWLGLSLLSRKIGPVGMPISAAAAAMLALVVMRVSPVGGLTQAPATSSPEPVAVAITAPSVPAATASPMQSSVFSAPGTLDAQPQTQVAAQEPQAASLELAAAAKPAPTKRAASLRANTGPTSPVEAANALAAAAAGTAVTKTSPDTATATPGLAEMKVQVLVSASPAIEPVTPDVATSSFALAADELQPDKTGLNPRQARLLSSATGVTEGKSLADVREQVLHRLVDNEARYASISRVGVNADRLSLKF
jgi:hypothetical protein